MWPHPVLDDMSGPQSPRDKLPRCNHPTVPSPSTRHPSHAGQNLTSGPLTGHERDGVPAQLKPPSFSTPESHPQGTATAHTLPPPDMRGENRKPTLSANSPACVGVGQAYHSHQAPSLCSAHLCTAASGPPNGPITGHSGHVTWASTRSLCCCCMFSRWLHKYLLYLVSPLPAHLVAASWLLTHCAAAARTWGRELPQMLHPQRGTRMWTPARTAKTSAAQSLSPTVSPSLPQCPPRRATTHPSPLNAPSNTLNPPVAPLPVPVLPFAHKARLLWSLREGQNCHVPVPMPEMPPFRRVTLDLHGHPATSTPQSHAEELASTNPCCPPRSTPSCTITLHGQV
jgi:hypothetical protein